MQTGKIVFDVTKPPAEVWARLVDLERAPDWVRSMRGSDKTTPGPVSVGTIFTQKVELNGATNQADIKVTEYEEFNTFAHEGQSGPAAYSSRFELEAIEGGTRVVHSFSVSIGGIMQMMEPMMGAWLKKNSRESVFNLKRLIEAGQ